MQKRRFAYLVAALAAAACVWPSPAGAAVSVGHSGWFWGNPLPQGNDIRALEFAGARGFAAGAFGTLLRSDDRGSTWTGIPTGLTTTIDRIDVISPSSVVVGGGCAARRSDDGGRTFRPLSFAPSELRCKEAIVAMSFVSSDDGFLLLDDGALLFTSDGGSTFTRRTAIPGSAAKGGSQQPTDIFFTSARRGVAVSTSNGSQGGIYLTRDGGDTWTEARNAGGRFHSVWFADASTGYAVGDGGTLFATGDGGASWSLRPLSGAALANLTAIRCAGPACLLSVDDGSHLVRTTDRGFTASDVSPSSLPIFAAAFASRTQVVAAGRDGATVVSGDGGLTFSPIPAAGGRIAGPFQRLRAAAPKLAFAAGRGGTLARTSDGGHTWTALPVPTSRDVVDVAFPRPRSGFALDSAGTLLKTVNGGAAWTVLDTGAASRPSTLLALGARRILLVGPRGVRRSTNGGGSFHAVPGRIRRAPVQFADVARGAVFAYGPHALLVSTSRGASWKRVKRPTRKALRRVDFVTRRRGFALDAQGKVWTTANRGRRWKQLLATGTFSGYDLAFTAAGRGYLAIASFGIQRGGFLLKTADGGRTWHPQLVSARPLVRGGIAGSTGRTDFATDGRGLFATSTGGDQGAFSSLRLHAPQKTVKGGSTIEVSGKLTPAAGGELVEVSARVARHGWVHKLLPVAADGTFTTVWSVSRPTMFVAQWAGDADHEGAGSHVLRVRVVK